MTTTDFQKVYYVSCEEESNGYNANQFKGLFSTLEKALDFIMNDVDHDIYDFSNTKYGEVTVDNINKIIEEQGVCILSAHDSGRRPGLFPCFDQIKNAPKYYYINLEEIK